MPIGTQKQRNTVTTEKDKKTNIHGKIDHMKERQTERYAHK